MTQEIFLRRKWTLRTHGQQNIFVKNPRERPEHVLMKALLWSLYLCDYPNANVEVSIGDRYKPDVVSMYIPSIEEPTLIGQPRFWAEAGQVSVKKYHSLFKRFPDTHFAFGRWNTNLAPHIKIAQKAMGTNPRHAPVDMICFPSDSAARFIDGKGNIDITHEQLTWVSLA